MTKHAAVKAQNSTWENLMYYQYLHVLKVLIQMRAGVRKYAYYGIIDHSIEFHEKF